MPGTTQGKHYPSGLFSTFFPSRAICLWKISTAPTDHDLDHASSSPAVVKRLYRICMVQTRAGSCRLLHASHLAAAWAIYIYLIKLRDLSALKDLSHESGIDHTDRTDRLGPYPSLCIHQCRAYVYRRWFGCNRLENLSWSAYCICVFSRYHVDMRV